MLSFQSTNKQLSINSYKEISSPNDDSFLEERPNRFINISTITGSTNNSSLHKKKITSCISKKLELIEYPQKKIINNSSEKNLVDINNIQMTTVTINIVVNYNIKQLTMIQPNHTTFKKLLERVIIRFNQMFESENLNYRLITDLKKYSFKPSKKNGFPKNDYPSFDPDTHLYNTQKLRFTLVWNDNPEDFNSYLKYKMNITRAFACRNFCVIS